MPHEGETALHGFRIAGRIENNIKEIAARDIRELILVAFTERDDMRHTEMRLAKIQPVRTTIDHRHHTAVQNSKNSHCHTDRSGADDQNLLVLFNSSAPHGMRTDGQELGHRSLIQRQPFGLQHELLRHTQIFDHPAIAMDAQNTDIAAAIALAFQACAAMTTGHVGNDSDDIPVRQHTSIGRFFDRTGELVSHDTRI